MRSRIYHLICRDPTRLNVSCLQSLTQLELVGCDLSTSAWLGLEMVQPRLRALTCRDSLEELWHLLAPSLRRNGNHGRAACSLALQIAASCGRMMQILAPAKCSHACAKHQRHRQANTYPLQSEVVPPSWPVCHLSVMFLPQHP